MARPSTHDGWMRSDRPVDDDEQQARPTSAAKSARMQRFQTLSGSTPTDAGGALSQQQRQKHAKAAMSAVGRE